MLSHYIKVIVFFRKFLNFDFRMYYSFFNDKISVFPADFFGQDQMK